MASGNVVNPNFVTPQNKNASSLYKGIQVYWRNETGDELLGFFMKKTKNFVESTKIGNEPLMFPLKELKPMDDRLKKMVKDEHDILNKYLLELDLNMKQILAPFPEEFLNTKIHDVLAQVKELNDDNSPMSTESFITALGNIPVIENDWASLEPKKNSAVLLNATFDSEDDITSEERPVSSDLNSNSTTTEENEVILANQLENVHLSAKAVVKRDSPVGELANFPTSAKNAVAKPVFVFEGKKSREIHPGEVLFSASGSPIKLHPNSNITNTPATPELPVGKPLTIRVDGPNGGTELKFDIRLRQGEAESFRSFVTDLRCFVATRSAMPTRNLPARLPTGASSLRKRSRKAHHSVSSASSSTKVRPNWKY